MLDARALMNDDRFWQIIDQAGLVSPMNGGCLVFAKALQRVRGGGLVRIVSDAAGGQTEHYGLLIEGEIWDASGSHYSSEYWLQAFQEEEHITDRKLAFAQGYDDTGDIPDDPAATKALAALMAHSIEPDFSEDHYEQSNPRA